MKYEVTMTCIFKWKLFFSFPINACLAYMIDHDLSYFTQMCIDTRQGVGVHMFCARISMALLSKWCQNGNSHGIFDGNFKVWCISSLKFWIFVDLILFSTSLVNKVSV